LCKKENGDSQAILKILFVFFQRPVDSQRILIYIDLVAKEMTTMEKGLKKRSVYFRKGMQPHEGKNGRAKRGDKVILNTTKEHIFRMKNL